MRTYQEMDVGPVSPSSTSGCEQSRSRDSERVVRMFRETHAISAIASSTKQDVSLRVQKSTTGPNQRKHRKNDVRMVWEVDAISAKTNSTTGCEVELTTAQEHINSCRTINTTPTTLFGGYIQYTESRKINEY